MAHFVYILFSQKLDKFYTGETSDVERRIDFQLNSPHYKFTGKAKDWELFLEMTCTCKAQALSIEAHIKRMKSITYIKNLKQYPEMRARLLKKYMDDC